MQKELVWLQRQELSRTGLVMGKRLSSKKALEHLRASGPHMAELIDRVGPCQMKTSDRLSPFQSLLRAIVYQMLAGHAAAAIYGRVQGLCDNPSDMQPAEILQLDAAALLDAGLSRAKLAAVLDLAENCHSGIVPSLRELKTLSDADIIKRITVVRGVGQWTVEMMLIYLLGRPDVLPVGDFAVRKGYQLAWRKKESPKPARLARFGLRWSPYRTVASWYLWRATDSVDWSKQP